MFEEASTVFEDSLAYIFEDKWHSIEEHREIIIGHSAQGRLLLVCFTERGDGNIRLVSSRLATKQERKTYYEHHRPF
jgi:hypothetical protein